MSVYSMLCCNLLWSRLCSLNAIEDSVKKLCPIVYSYFEVRRCNDVHNHRWFK